MVDIVAMDTVLYHGEVDLKSCAVKGRDSLRMVQL